jgi:hypothetical protein
MNEIIQQAREILEENEMLQEEANIHAAGFTIVAFMTIAFVCLFVGAVAASFIGR